MYSRDNIKEAIKNGRLKIYPYEEKNLTGIGYNLSTTNFAFSVSKGILLTIHKRTSENGAEHFVIIPPNDTVLFFSKEYIAIDNTLSGTFHSKVARVSQGLAHISTTLDPTWKGQLIISVNNPTNKKIEFDLDKKSGNILTMLLYNLASPVTGNNIHDNNQGRCDLLLGHFSKAFSSGKYRKKHLELEEFIVNDFASSLNGYDEFIQEFDRDDKYSKRLRELMDMCRRMRNHQILFTENRYLFGPGGRYYIFESLEECAIMKECAIFKIMGLDENVLKKGFSDTDADKSEVREYLKKYINIVEYEIETINHLRRIEWQNEEIEKFANDDSPLVKMQKRRNLLWALLKVAGIIAVSGVLVGIGYRITTMPGNRTPNILPVFAALCGGWATFCLNSIINIYKTYCDGKN